MTSPNLDSDADFEEAMAAMDRIIKDKALQQELLGAGLLIRVDPKTGAPDSTLDSPVGALPLSGEARIERAEREVIRLTGSGPGGSRDRSFRMTIPAEPDRDSDLVLMDGLDAGREALATLAARQPDPGLDALPPATCYRVHTQPDEHLGVKGAVWIADALRGAAYGSQPDREDR